MANIYYKMVNQCIQEKYIKNYISNFQLEIVEECSRIKDSAHRCADFIVENNPVDYIDSNETLKMFVYNKINQASN